MKSKTLCEIFMDEKRLHFIQLRQSLGLSQYRVAKLLGVSRTHYHLFERGERALGSARLAMLTALLSLPND